MLHIEHFSFKMLPISEYLEQGLLSGRTTIMEYCPHLPALKDLRYIQLGPGKMSIILKIQETGYKYKGLWTSDIMTYLSHKLGRS